MFLHSYFVAMIFSLLALGAVDQQASMVEATLRLATDSRGNRLYLDVALKLRLAASLYDIAVMIWDWVSEFRQPGLE